MDESTSLQELVSFLARPASYPHRPESVRIIQTHISIVALASPYVYKLKKPVIMGFLDFSTLKKRHHYCREELRLNRRLCSSTYLEVLPIFRSEAGLTFDQGNEIVDYVVQMKQLPEGFFLHEMLENGEVTRPCEVYHYNGLGILLAM